MRRSSRAAARAVVRVRHRADRLPAVLGVRRPMAMPPAEGTAPPPYVAPRGHGGRRGSARARSRGRGVRDDAHREGARARGGHPRRPLGGSRRRAGPNRRAPATSRSSDRSTRLAPSSVCSSTRRRRSRRAAELDRRVAAFAVVARGADAWLDRGALAGAGRGSGAGADRGQPEGHGRSRRRRGEPQPAEIRRRDRGRRRSVARVPAAACGRRWACPPQRRFPIRASRRSSRSRPERAAAPISPRPFPFRRPNDDTGGAHARMSGPRESFPVARGARAAHTCTAWVPPRTVIRPPSAAKALCVPARMRAAGLSMRRSETVVSSEFH